MPSPVLAPVGASKSGGLFLLRDHRVDGATPEPSAPALELEEDEIVGWLLFSVLPPAASLGKAHATDPAWLPFFGESLRLKEETWDPDIVDLVRKL